MSDAPWIRTCQECGTKQETPPPAKPPTPAWMFKKCKRCKSSALDYGSFDYGDAPEDDDE